MADNAQISGNIFDMTMVIGDQQAADNSLTVRSLITGIVPGNENI